MANDASIVLMAAAKCDPLIVENAQPISDKFTGDTVDLNCGEGFMQVGGSATCSPNGPGKAAWTNIPKCEGLFAGCLCARTLFFSRVYRRA